jgi:hypothetical protein
MWLRDVATWIMDDKQGDCLPACGEAKVEEDDG